MSYLGSTDVSFRLGAGEVSAVYLGSQEVWSAVVPTTLFLNGLFGEQSWLETDAWFFDAEFLMPAGRIPVAADSVVVDGYNVDGAGQTVQDITVTNGFLVGSLTVTGMATFNTSGASNATITGNATFNNDSSNQGSVSGTATFNDSACNVTGSGTAGTFVPDPPPACPE